ncbi:hypothetical protein J4Q44_G00389880 [Coregonus suidteri]|uniref:Uncharacterized protein n=1 Tax=Coregonus suidteri TaxID=861788 RepID=A0AAN8QBW6_9TELE
MKADQLKTEPESRASQRCSTEPRGHRPFLIMRMLASFNQILTRLWTTNRTTDNRK